MILPMELHWQAVLFQLRFAFLQLYFSTFGPKATLQLQCDIEVEPLRTEIIPGPASAL